MKDLSGDGFIGGRTKFRGYAFKSGGHYKLGRKYRKPHYLLSELLYMLLVIVIIGFIIVAILAFTNNDIGITAVQTLIGGVK